MPRIPGPVEPRAPAPIVNLPRAPEISPAPTGLVEFGRQLGETGQELLEFAVDQERRSEVLRIKTFAEQRYGELRRRVDEAGTSAEGRRLWETEGPKVRAEVARFAQERGLPELTAELDLIAATQNNEVLGALNKRSWREAIDAGAAFAAAKLEAIVAARSEPEVQRHKVELHRALEQLAADNPVFSAGDADRLFQSTISDAAVRRVRRLINDSADDPGALAQLRGALSEGRFADLPEDARADFEVTIGEMIDRARAKLERDRLASGARTLSDLQVAIIDATTPAELTSLRASIEDLFAAELITPAQRVSAIGAIETKRNQLLNADRTAQEALVALQTGTLKSQAQADDAYAAVVAANPDRAEMEPQEALNFDLSFAAEAGYLPPHLRLAIENAEHTNDPGELAHGAMIEQRVREVAPHARRNPGLRVLDTIALAEQAQIPIDQAAIRVHEAIPDRATREERDAEFAEAFPELDIRDWLFERGLASVHRPLFPDARATVDAADARRAEETLRLAYRQTGDPARAAEVATRWLQRQGYGVTALGGGEPRFMRFAPEAMIPPGVPPAALDAFAELYPEILDADVRQSLAEHGVEIPPAVVEGVPDYALRPIEGTTERQVAAGERPEYELLVRDEDGILAPVFVTFDDGTAATLTYRLPTFEEITHSEVWARIINEARGTPARNDLIFPEGGGS